MSEDIQTLTSTLATLSQAQASQQPTQKTQEVQAPALQVQNAPAVAAAPAPAPAPAPVPALAPVAAANPDSPTKRRPGRPKGSGKRQQFEVIMEPRVKRPVGRPRKDGLPAGSVGPKRPPGRPKKRPPGTFASGSTGQAPQVLTYTVRVFYENVAHHLHLLSRPLRHHMANNGVRRSQHPQWLRCSTDRPLYPHLHLLLPLSLQSLTPTSTQTTGKVCVKDTTSSCITLSHRFMPPTPLLRVEFVSTKHSSRTCTRCKITVNWALLPPRSLSYIPR